MPSRRTELDRFFDLALDIFAIADMDGRWIRASAAVSSILGYSVDEVYREFYRESVANALAFLDGKPVRVLRLDT